VQTPDHRELTMTFEETLEFVEATLESKIEKPLTASEKQILKAAWDNETYSNLAESLHLSVGHIKDLASLLWQRLSYAFGEKITKNNFRWVIEVRCGTSLSSEEKIAETNPDENEDPQGNILIVDDLVENLDFLTKLLTEYGYKVRSVTNGKMALRTIQKTHPDVILLDIAMPEMNGYQVCEALKADETTSEIPVIFLSALDEVFDKVKAFQVGGVDYITKPCEPKEVIARLQTQLIIQQQKRKLKQQIEHHQQTAEILHQSRALLANLLNSSKDGIMALQAERDIITEEIKDFHCLIINPVFVKLLGQKREDLIGKIIPQKILDKITPKLFNSLIKVVETGEEIEKKNFLEK
jgi:DNA-binding response OmpR family regulator